MQFSIRNEGTVSVLFPLDTETTEWVDSHVSVPSYMRWNNPYGPSSAIVIEHRYVSAIVEGLTVAGAECFPEGHKAKDVSQCTD